MGVRWRAGRVKWKLQTISKSLFKLVSIWISPSVTCYLNRFLNYVNVQPLPESKREDIVYALMIPEFLLYDFHSE